MYKLKDEKKWEKHVEGEGLENYGNVALDFDFGKHYTHT